MATKQVNPKGRGGNRNPTGKGGFQERPEDRSNGRWTPEGSISYNYNKLIRMTAKEIKSYKPETVAQEIALARVKAAKSEKFGLSDAKELADRTEGKAPQYIGVGDPKEARKALVEFLNATNGN